MKKQIRLVSFILIVFLLSGCAIKRTDSPTTKILKHTANAPLYLLAGSVILLNIFYYRPYYTHGHRIRYHGYYTNSHRYYRH